MRAARCAASLPAQQSFCLQVTSMAHGSTEQEEKLSPQHSLSQGDNCPSGLGVTLRRLASADAQLALAEEEARFVAGAADRIAALALAARGHIRSLIADLLAPFAGQQQQQHGDEEEDSIPRV